MNKTGILNGSSELNGGISAAQRVTGSANKLSVIHGQTPYIKDGNWWIGEVDTGVRAEGVSGSDGLSPVVTVTDIEGGHKVIITDKNGTKEFDVLDGIGGSGGSGSARIADVELKASAWVGSQTPYSQVVTIPTVTKYTQVDLTPSAEQLSVFYNKDLAFVTENTNGVVTVYAIGQKPANDYTIQATLTEVSV